MSQKTVNIYIIYELILHNSNSNYPTSENCLFGAVKLQWVPTLIIINILGMELDFDRKGFFSIGDEIGRNVIIFGIDISSSPYTDNKRKDILILGKGPIQE